MKKMKVTWSHIGWIAGGMVIFAYGSAVWRGPNFQELVCADSGNDCFREWVSALGGWAAVAAAVPTVRFLARQIKDANRHQKENLQIQLRRTRVLAMSAKQSAQVVRTIVDVIQKMWKETDEEKFPGIPYKDNYKMYVDLLGRQLQDDIFVSFETEIAVVSPETIGSLRAALNSIRPNERFEVFGVVDYSWLRIQITYIATVVDGWMFKCISECDSYLVEIQELIDPDTTA